MKKRKTNVVHKDGVKHKGISVTSSDNKPNFEKRKKVAIVLALVFGIPVVIGLATGHTPEAGNSIAGLFFLVLFIGIFVVAAWIIAQFIKLIIHFLR